MENFNIVITYVNVQWNTDISFVTMARHIVENFGNPLQFTDSRANFASESFMATTLSTSITPVNVVNAMADDTLVWHLHNVDVLIVWLSGWNRRSSMADHLGEDLICLLADWL